MNYQELQKQQIDYLESLACSDHFPASVVEPVADYVNDNRKYLTIAAYPTPEILKSITTRFVSDLQAADNQPYYCEPDSLHFTILSIKLFEDGGNFDAVRVAEIIEATKKVFATQPSFEFTMQGSLALPTSIGVRCYSSDALQTLINNLKSALAAIDVVSDKKLISDEIFFGNITVCRFKPNYHPSEKLKAIVKKYHDTDFGRMKLTSAKLIHGNAVISTHNSEILAEFKLG